MKLTSAMLVVSNTSPLSNLAMIGQLDLVRGQLKSVVIPPAVRDELGHMPNQAAGATLAAALQDGWIRVMPLNKRVPRDFAPELDIGEAEALALALETRASLVLLDESAARARAKALGLAFTGVLGLLRHAKQTGRIQSLGEQMRRLREEAHFFISPALEKALLVSVGEI